MNTENTLDFGYRRSPAIRIWHWTLFVVLTGSIVTVTLASTLFRTRNNIATVQAPLKEKGVLLNDDQARAVAHEFNDRLWALHTWLGYILCFLVLSRIVIEALQPADEKFSRRLRVALGFKPVTPQQRGEVQHHLLVKRSYLVFYAAITIMALTGLILAFEDVSLFHAWRAPAKQVHAFVQYVIYGFAVLHLAGVIRADLTQYPGIISSMIHGQGRKSDSR